MAIRQKMTRLFLQAAQRVNTLDSRMLFSDAKVNALIERLQQSLTSSRSNENEACQLQQDNKSFTYAVCLTLLRLPMHLFLERCEHAAQFTGSS